jgi:aryl-alcohol dehydrogenase-like predicted oxidoreductase/histidinol phosphatase-like enzyme/predicted kinase
MLGMGCMRLSTAEDRDDERSIAVIHAALDAGVTFLDTADAYCHSEADFNHNERLIARALRTWAGDSSRITVASKGGLTRPGGRWVADGRGRHLSAACDASCRALGVERVPLYQLHVVDPRTPLSTSVKALAALERERRIERIGLCNVTVGQIEQARAIVEIDAVQVELSPWRDDAFLGGVARYCADHGIQLIAHRPLGGPERSRRALSDPALLDVASRHGASVFEVTLAWLRDLPGTILPIPGPTRVETARSLGRVSQIRLTDEDRARLDERFPSVRVLRLPPAAAHDPIAPLQASGEVVLIMGLPGAGKSLFTRSFIDRGYVRLNRDVQGGSLRDLVPSLDRVVEAGQSHVVLDNTYVSRKARAPVVHAAARHGLPVRCVWLATTIDDAQVNAAARMMSTFGRLLEPDEMRQTSKRDPSVFGPMVHFRYQRELEPPDRSEGFADIEVVPFQRTWPATHTNRAVIVWCDGILARSRSGERFPTAPEDLEVPPAYGDVLRRYVDDGWRLCGLSWQPEIGAGARSASDVDAVFNSLRHRLAVPIDVQYCSHVAGPPACWCRKPLPGLGVLLIERYDLDPLQCMYVGDGAQDPGFARKLGFQYVEAGDFFGQS